MSFELINVGSLVQSPDKTLTDIAANGTALSAYFLNWLVQYKPLYVFHKHPPFIVFRGVPPSIVLMLAHKRFLSLSSFSKNSFALVVS